jgi:hypothetical protein
VNSSAKKLLNTPHAFTAQPALAGGPAAPGASSARPFDLEQDLARMADDGGPVTVLRSSRPTALPALVRGSGLVRRAAGVLGDLLMLTGVVWGLGVSILAVGIPVALVARLLVWMSGGV